MKILVLAKYMRSGASSRLRVMQYIPYLQANGHDVTVTHLFDDEYLGFLYQSGRRMPLKVAVLYWRRLLALVGVASYDLIWIEKEVWPYLPAFGESVFYLIRKPYVVDYDDAVFHNYDLSSNSIIRRLLGRKIDTVMRLSTCVVAGNAYLAERAVKAGAQRVELLPTVVDHTRYFPKRHALVDQPVLGWIGSPSTQKYVVGIYGALKKICNEFGARLMLVGATHDVALQLPDLKVEVVAWSEENEVAMIAKMDIGIMPLQDGPWEKGKCGYKLIQYMACAVPVIASSVGVNVDIVKSSHSGLLADTLVEWEDALRHLLTSLQHRAMYGASGRRAVEEAYSLQAQAPILQRILSHAVHTKNS